MKTTIAIILELLPVISAPLSYLLIITDFNSRFVGGMIAITLLLSFLGFVFFFIGRKLAKGNKAVLILGILDWLATAYTLALAALVALAFGL